MSKGNKIVIGLLIFIIIGIGTVLTLNELEVIELCNCKCTSCPKSVQNVPEEKAVNSQVVYAIYDGNSITSKILLNTNGELILDLDGVNNVLANNIIKAVHITYGKTDICGHDIVAMIDTNNKLSAIRLDDYVCGVNTHDVNAIKKIDNLKSYDKKVIDLFNEPQFSNQYEPFNYIVKAQLEDGTTEDITNYFE